MVYVAIGMAIVIMIVAAIVCVWAIDHEIKVGRLPEDEFKGLPKPKDDE